VFTVTALPDFADEQKRVIAATVAGLRIVDFYVPNGQSVDSDKYRYKLEWCRAATAFLARESARHEALVVVGDFNIAPEDRDVYDPVAWAGQIHCTDEERGHFRQLVGLGLHDAFRLFEQPEKSYSWWDYRMMAFRRNAGLRIDLILASTKLAEKCVQSRIDKTPRKLERPSDHTPVLATFDI
jgi:exodeoxyribonuclease-3